MTLSLRKRIVLELASDITAFVALTARNPCAQQMLPTVPPVPLLLTSCSSSLPTLCKEQGFKLKRNIAVLGKHHSSLFSQNSVSEPLNSLQTSTQVTHPCALRSSWTCRFVSDSLHSCLTPLDRNHDTLVTYLKFAQYALQTTRIPAEQMHVTPFEIRCFSKSQLRWDLGTVRSTTNQNIRYLKCSRCM